MSQKFYSDIEVKAGLRDSSGSLGTSGQILSSTSGNVSWVTPTVNTVASDVQNEVKAGVAINKGQAVYVTGADGTNIIVGLASNTSEATSSKTLGLLNATVATNDFADVVQIGRLAGLNTIGATAGDPVWLGVNGNLIYGLANKPYAPAHLVFLGIVTRVNANNGEIFVNVQNGFELKEIHDVDIITNVPINGDILGYDGTLWVNKTIAEWLGYTPANANGTTNYVSKFTGNNSLGNSSIFDNGSAVGIFTSAPNFVTPGRGVLSLNGSSNSLMEFQAGGAFKSYLYQSGTNFEIYDTNAILFAVSGSERMRITSSGNVGIGTTSPGERLQVLGNIRLTNNNLTIPNSVSSEINNFNGSNNQFKSSSIKFLTGTFVDQGNITFNTSISGVDQERLRISETGNVGIGTTSPAAKLTINADDNSNANAITIYSNNTTAQSYTSIGSYYANGNTNVNSQIRFGNENTNGGESYLALATGSVSATEAMRITSGGNVGIGTSSPTFVTTGTTVLDVNGSTGAAIYLRANIAQGSYLRQTSNNLVIGNNTYGDIIYNTGFTEAMRITADRLVGIGTTSPNSLLQVGSSNFVITDRTSAVYGPESQTIFTVGRSGVDYPQLLNFGVNQAGLYSSISARQFTVSTENNLVLQPNGGNVGIGTTSPATKLTVEGILATKPAGVDAYYSYLRSNWSADNAFELGISAFGSSIYHKLITSSGYYNGETLQFWTNDSERARFDISGNFGINTTAPIHKLSVNGKIGGDIFGDSHIEFLSNGNTSLKANNSVLIGYSQSTVVTQSGNVGIGTTSPHASALLHLRSTTQGFLPPVMRTGERDSIGSPAAGLMIFNEDDEVIQVYTNGSGWRTLAFL